MNRLDRPIVTVDKEFEARFQLTVYLMIVRESDSFYVAFAPADSAAAVRQGGEYDVEEVFSIEISGEEEVIAWAFVEALTMTWPGIDLIEKMLDAAFQKGREVECFQNVLRQGDPLCRPPFLAVDYERTKHGVSEPERATILIDVDCKTRAFLADNTSLDTFPIPEGVQVGTALPRLLRWLEQAGQQPTRIYVVRNDDTVPQFIFRNGAIVALPSNIV